jgi:DNA-binding MarR family transcriptional regulator
MARSRQAGPSGSAEPGIGFLLSQVGALTAARFAEGLEPLGLKPAHAGILRALAEADGLSQQALGEKLGAFPSRLVGLLDEMERRGLVERRDNPADRRSYSLYVTKAGYEALEKIRRVGRDYEDALCAPLSESERVQLLSILERIAVRQGLTPGVHPGFRKLASNERE